MLKFIMTDEDAQRVYAKKLAADRESQKRKRAEELPEQRESRLAAKRDRAKPKILEILSVILKRGYLSITNSIFFDL